MSHQMHYQPGPQAPMGAQGHQAARNGLGTAALVLGLIGALSGLIPLFFWLAGLLGLLALIFGLVGRGRAKRGEATNKGMATAGALLGLASLILSIVGMSIFFKAAKDAVDEINKTVGAAPIEGGGAMGAAGTNGAAGPAAYGTATVSKTVHWQTNA
ncbi:DUF4190 domain-containing protein [Streptomyces sp. MST-110588]|nr:DUF4190 domain-containing protein [Streptomyces sp. MST-110588]